LSPAERFATGTARRRCARDAAQRASLRAALAWAASSLAPARCLRPWQADDDFGWPYCYYDASQRKYALAPEYGGDGSKPGRMHRPEAPRVVFPSHWAPSAMAFYAESAFPRDYRGGAFVAFEAGSLVAFVPFGEDGAVGRYEVFATATAHRPTAVAVGPTARFMCRNESQSVASGRSATKEPEMRRHVKDEIGLPCRRASRAVRGRHPPPGCSGFRSPAQQAGFQARAADSPSRQQDLVKMPRARSSSATRTAAAVYSFADPDNCRCLYVGGQKEYAKLQELRQQRIDDHNQLAGRSSFEGGISDLWGPWKPEGLIVK